MLFMIIERFRNGDPKPVGERFQAKGRMMPDGVVYKASWLDPVTASCYQVMEAPSQEALQPWLDAWSDIVDFEVIPVMESPEYWAMVNSA